MVPVNGVIQYLRVRDHLDTTTFKQAAASFFGTEELELFVYWYGDSLPSGELKRRMSDEPGDGHFYRPD